MEPSSAEIKQLLDEAGKNPVDLPWVKHTLCVGDTAAVIAQALQNSGQNLDPERVRTLGYLHDIGKMGGNYHFLGHVLDGYAYLKRRGYDEDYCAISLTHSFPNNNPELTVSSPIFDPEFLPTPEHMQTLGDVIPDGDGVKFLTDFIVDHDFTLEDHIICLCDMICLDRPTTLEQRLIDVISRHGTWKNTQPTILEAMKLKHELDELLGHDLYELWR